MLLGILIAVIITAALGYSLQSERRGGMIDHHGYNNRHNDATGARDDHLG